MKYACLWPIAVLICAFYGTPSHGQVGSKLARGALSVGDKAGQVRDDNGLGMRFVWCPPGSFTLEQIEDGEAPVVPGVDRKEIHPPTERKPPAEVSLSQGFWMGQCEVTQAEWQRVMGTCPWDVNGERIPKQDNMPATWMNWFDAMEFCSRLNRQERVAGRLLAGWEYTLPTEAQWEYACRAETRTRFHFGDDDTALGEFEWFYDNTTQVREAYAHPVGKKRPNGWGLFDMHGNVAEMCRDFYQPRLSGGVDPHSVEAGWNLVVRGGSFNHGANECRSACRDGGSPIPGGECCGFRLVLSLGDFQSTDERVRKFKHTIPILTETSRSGPALEAAARKAGALPGDDPDVVAAIVRIDSLGGRIWRDYDRIDAPVSEIFLNFSHRLRDSDLRFLKPLDAVQDAYFAYTLASDEGLEHIARLSELRVLNLSGTEVTDSGMRTLQRCSKLQKLYLAGTAISDEGLKSLSGLKTLSVLDLSETQITDSGLRSLFGLESLVQVDFLGANVSQAALDDLKAHCPLLKTKPPKPVVAKSSAPSPLEGVAAQDWATTDLAGTAHALRQYQGNVVILDFWFNQCVWCRRTIPQVSKVADHFKGRQVVIMGVSTDEKEQDAMSVVERMGLKYPVLKGREIAEKYQIEGFPTLLIIDQQGIIRKVHVGYSPTLREDLIKDIEGLLRRD